MFDQPRAFAESIRATEQNCNNVTWEHAGVLALLDHFGFPVGGKNQALSRASCPARFHPVDTVRPQKFVCVSQEITQRACAALKRDLPLFLRNIETKTGLVHRVAPDSYEAALSIAQTLSRNSPEAVALTKQLVLADRRKRILEFAAQVDHARSQVTQSPEYRDLLEKSPNTVRRRVE